MQLWHEGWQGLHKSSAGSLYFGTSVGDSNGQKATHYPGKVGSAGIFSFPSMHS